MSLTRFEKRLLEGLGKQPMTVELLHGVLNTQSVLHRYVSLGTVSATVHRLAAAGVVVQDGLGVWRVAPKQWDITQVHVFVMEAISAQKAAFDLVPSVRRAIIAQKFTSIVTALAIESIHVHALEQLWEDMLAVADTYGVQ